MLCLKIKHFPATLIEKRLFGAASVTNRAIEPKRESLDECIVRNQDKFIYNTVVEKYRKRTQNNRKHLQTLQVVRAKRLLKKLESIEPLPVALNYLSGSSKKLDSCGDDCRENRKEPADRDVHFPFGSKGKSVLVGDIVVEDETAHESSCDKLATEIERRKELMKNSWQWMNDYENYDRIDADEDGVRDAWKINYGTPDPNLPISNVPCGGCGAYLHCKEPSLPGYIPSEIYKNRWKSGAIDLSASTCQRCHFLNNYNLALQVTVSQDEYSSMMRSIENKHALVLLMVDLLDFPCSIWPDIDSIVGTNKTVVVVGNKVDMLPVTDEPGYLKHVKNVLEQTVKGYLRRKSVKNVQHTTLISAKTGWGVEELITNLQKTWGTKGDVYLLGCTNVGKSTLFNCLLQSDYCKIQAVDLIRRATTSHWPGTTLNLLKFPILRPSGWRLYVRTKRLQSSNKLHKQEERLRRIQSNGDRNSRYANLVGHMDRTFLPERNRKESADPFAMESGGAAGQTKIGIDETTRDYVMSKWCYDTPGVVHSEQIIHLLTAEEILSVLPKDSIKPRTFLMKPNWSLLIGGLARIDYLQGDKRIRVTVFSASTLPITICQQEDVEEIFARFLGTTVLGVPMGAGERLEMWPKLQCSDVMKVKGLGKNTSCNDIVLSNAGWVAVTCEENEQVALRAWTPERRGIYMRKSLLPKAVASRGRLMRFSPAHVNKID